MIESCSLDSPGQTYVALGFPGKRPEVGIVDHITPFVYKPMQLGWFVLMAGSLGI